MIRWMETLVERAGAAGSLPTIQKLWASDRLRSPYPEDTTHLRQSRGIRVLNFVVALAALIILSPVLLIIALLVRLTSRGPVFYTQTRVGMDRRQRRARLPPRHRRAGRQQCGRAGCDESATIDVHPWVIPPSRWSAGRW